MSYSASAVGGPMPLGRSSRVGWGPGGVIAFASGKEVRIIKLAEMDAACSEDGGVVAASEHASGMMDVRVRKSARCERAAPGSASHKRLPDATALELSIREFKEASAAVVQPSERQRQRQHLWKLVGALLAGTLRPDREGELDSGSDLEHASLQAARRREAVVSWLRLTLVEDAARADARTPASDVGSRVLELASRLQTDGAIQAAIAGPKPHAYLAAILAQPVASVRSDMADQLVAWQKQQHGLEAMALAGNGGAERLLPASLARITALLAGTAPPADVASWRAHYAHTLVHGTAGCERVPPPPPLPGSATPPDTAWHLLRLVLDPGAELALLPPREPPGRSGRSGAVRLHDSSLAWHLRLVVGELLQLHPPTADETVHRDYLAQLEMTGCWHEHLFATTALPSSPRDDTAALASALRRFPPPDLPSPPHAHLLDLAPLDQPAPLTAAAEALATHWLAAPGVASHPQDPDRIYALLHAALALRSADDRRPAAVVRHYLTAAAAAAAADASPPGIAACGSIVSTMSDLWPLAHRALCRELLPPMLLGAGTGEADIPPNLWLPPNAGFPPDAARALELLSLAAPPGATATAEWARGGDVMLRYRRCMTAYEELVACRQQGRPEAAPLSLAAILEEAQSLALRLEDARAARAQPEPDELAFGTWADASIAEHACHDAMRRKVEALIGRVQWYGGQDTQMATD